MIECLGSYIISFGWATWDEIEMEMEMEIVLDKENKFPNFTFNSIEEFRKFYLERHFATISFTSLFCVEPWMDGNSFFEFRCFQTDKRNFMNVLFLFSPCVIFDAMVMWLKWNETNRQTKWKKRKRTILISFPFELLLFNAGIRKIFCLECSKKKWRSAWLSFQVGISNPFKCINFEGK